MFAAYMVYRSVGSHDATVVIVTVLAGAVFTLGFGPLLLYIGHMAHSAIVIRPLQEVQDALLRQIAAISHGPEAQPPAILPPNTTQPIEERMEGISFKRFPYSAEPNHWGDTKWMCEQHPNVELRYEAYQNEWRPIPTRREQMPGMTRATEEIYTLRCSGEGADEPHFFQRIRGQSPSWWAVKADADSRLDAQARAARDLARPRP
ncbi:MAG: hypothetical protein Q8M79_09875 [Dehalococcoidia bacterium]|nr:hypothetical protein [Dehalococcoidia bacterium]